MFVGDGTFVTDDASAHRDALRADTNEFEYAARAFVTLSAWRPVAAPSAGCSWLRRA